MPHSPVAPDGKAEFAGHPVDKGFQVRLFGAFDIRDASGQRLVIRSRSGHYVFAYLALRRGRPVERAKLADLFWTGGESGMESVKKCLQELAASLGPHSVRLQKTGEVVLDLDGSYGPDVPAAWCDFHEFSDVAARNDDASLRRAVELYNQGLLEPWGDFDTVWARYRKGAEQQFLGALRRLAARLASQSDYHEAAELMEKHVACRPDEERGWHLLLSYWDEAGERLLAASARKRYAKMLRERGQRMPDRLRVSGSLAETGLVPSRPAGPMPLDSAYYIERAADAQMHRALGRFEGIIRIKGPRYSGKSSLLARAIHQARDILDYRVVTTDFEQFAQSELVSMEAFCRALIGRLADQSGTPVVARPLLSSQPGADLNAYLRWGLLADGGAPRVVWAMDNIDRLFGCHWREDFFRLMRSWHNLRATHPDQPWNRLCQLIACSMEARLYLQDLNQSPFNTSEQIDVGDFSDDQAVALEKKWRSPLTGETADKSGAEIFWKAVGRHPYLVQQGLYALSVDHVDVVALLHCWERGEGPLGDHLRSIARLVAEDAGLQAALVRVFRGEPCPEDAFLRLRSAGILAGPHADQPRFRCGLYRRYLTPATPT